MKVGIIGYGQRVSGLAAKMLKLDGECQIAAIVDIRNKSIRKSMEEQGIRHLHYYETPEEMMAAQPLDGVMIGTRCSLHTEMALKVLPHGIPLLLEKPVATNMGDLLRLKAASEASPSQVVVSFPLRLTAIVKLIKEIIASGKIGTVEHVQAINNVSYGGIYYHNWYRDEKETGGLFLQKATHDFDYISHVLGLKPVSLCAMTSKQIFKGDKPAGLKCVDCGDNRTCEESTAYTEHRESWPYCCFAEDTGNEDSGSALIRYESGMHVSYSQNFYARRKAGARGARFLGYRGTLEFDFIANQVRIYMHHTPRVETYQLDESGELEHHIDQFAVARHFIDVMHGRARSESPLEDGLLSALMCLKAKESAETGTFREIEWT